MKILDIYNGLLEGKRYRRKTWSGTKYIYVDKQKFGRPIIVIHPKDNDLEGVYAFNNCDFFAEDWVEQKETVF